jgi:hypothetical protein
MSSPPLAASRQGGLGARVARPRPRRESLPPALHAGLETLSGFRLDGVSVHYNSPEPERLDAEAFTRGRTIHLAPGQERHLPHEGWHLVQQARGGVAANGRVAGKPLNDNPGLEREADVMGARAAGLGSPGGAARPAAMASAGSSEAGAVVQRKIRINGKTYGSAQPPPRKYVNTEARREAWDRMAASDALHEFSGLPAFDRAVKAAADRRAWWGQRGGAHDGVRQLSPHDPKYKDLVHEVMASHEEEPYSVDALHERGALLSSYHAGSKSGMLGALMTGSTWTGQAADARPRIEVTRIEMVKREAIRGRYEDAEADISARNVLAGRAPDPNVKKLYSGHGPPGMTHITQHGHDPNYGDYDPGYWFGGGKGHGAHGRGAYFTPQVDKAVSYSSSGQLPGEERSFFRQNVLLGHALEYDQRGLYRHRHHNEMVRTHRNGVAVTAPDPFTGVVGPVNKTNVNGVAATPAENMGQYDSLKGRKTYEPGSGLIGTAYHKSQFDSDEYMVRNADQVLPKYRIYYRIRP